jgi:beta-lactamase regulating signal transducer with metallopeptidase domain/ankyrin repeat protein
MIATIAQTAVSLTQWIEVSILAKATVMLALGLTAARLAARAPASVRHLLLAATFATLMALPLAALAVPGVVIQVPVADAAPRIATPLVAPRSAESPIPATVADQPQRSRSAVAIATLWPSAIRWGWLVGAAASCLSLGVAFGRLRRIRRDGLPRPELQALVESLAGRAGVRRVVGVLEHEEVAAPLTCGFWSPVILLPSDAREWNDADLRRALVHELEHVRRGDWAIQLAARVACGGYWFHPLVWIAWRQLGLEAERACDDAVVRAAERTDYADQLVLLARRLSQAHPPATLGMANRSDLAARVRALLDDHQRRGRAGRLAAASALAAAGLVVMAIAPVRAIAKREPVASVADAAPHRVDQDAVRASGRQPRVRGLDRALYEAAESGDLAEVDQLIQAGANVNAAIHGDGSPLIAAARANRPAVVGRLLDRGADPNMPVEGDGNPLIAAAREGASSIVVLLLDRGAEIDLIVPGDENALIQASGSGHLDIVKLLVARGADVNLRVWVESAGWRPQGEWRTPLSMARRGRHAAVVAFLLSAGARE